MRTILISSSVSVFCRRTVSGSRRSVSKIPPPLSGFAEVVGHGAVARGFQRDPLRKAALHGSGLTGDRTAGEQNGNALFHRLLSVRQPSGACRFKSGFLAKTKI